MTYFNTKGMVQASSPTWFHGLSSLRKVQVGARLLLWLKKEARKGEQGQEAVQGTVWHRHSFNSSRKF